MGNMKKTLLSLVLLTLLSCNNANNDPARQLPPDEVLSVDTAAILKDFNTWYTYTYHIIHLSQDFISLDTDSVKIDKAGFLEQLSSGNVAAFKVGVQRGTPVYKLYAIGTSSKDIKSTVEQLANIELDHYRMEGKELASFNFTDLAEKNYSSASTRGKILVLKCWFIRCVACVKEFPDCNKLVNEFKNRKDVLFISLASDHKKDLQIFLSSQVFSYAVIPEMDNYMTDKLGVDQYPTHILVNREGKIIKVTNSIKELAPFLKKEVEKTSKG
jgi:peroxiredoxin